MVEEIVHRSPWISAWSDPVAGVNSLTQLMAFADLKDDGNYKLLICDFKANCLKVYMGTIVLLNAHLSKGKPSALVVYYENNKKPMIPVIAVAVENTIFYYKDFNPYQKFDLPNVTFSDVENKIWKQLSTEDDEQ